MSKPLPSLPCQWGRCRQAACWRITARGPQGWLDTVTCPRHHDQTLGRAERQTGGTPTTTPLPNTPAEAPDQQLALDI